MLFLDFNFIIGVITLIYSFNRHESCNLGIYPNDNFFLESFFVYLWPGELGGGTFLNKVDKNRINAIDFSKWGVNNSNGIFFGFWPMVIGGFFLYASYYGTDQTQNNVFSSKTIQSKIRFFLMLYFVSSHLTYCFMGLVLGTLFINDISFQKTNLVIKVISIH